MTAVLDASVVAAALLERGDLGDWALERLAVTPRAAPALLPAEVANVLRRTCQRGGCTADVASQAYTDLLDLRIERVPFEPLAERVWELRDEVAAHDAWYVAIAERLGAPLVTLDAKLSRTPSARCRFDVFASG